MRKFLALCGAVALASVWAVVPASAGRLSFDSTPSSGPGGTDISVSGTGCDGLTITVTVEFDGDVLVQGTFESDNSWEGVLTVPTDATPRTYSVDAHCNLGDEQGFDYNSNSFTVTGAAPTTTTTTTTTVPVSVQATTTTTVAPVVVQAPPAAPVVAEPATAG